MDPFDLRHWAGFQSAGGSLAAPAVVDQIVIDSRRIVSKDCLFVALKGEKQNGHNYIPQAAESGAKYALVSLDWPSPSNLKNIILLRVRDPLRAFQEIARSYRLQLPVKILGVTGSFGKTMVKDLLHTFLTTQKIAAASPESFNSQIGVPLSLLTLRKEHEFAIIEAAISHKHEMDILTSLIRPDYTLLTPIGKKHLATLNDLATITEETMKLILSTPTTGWTLIPNDSLTQPYHNQLQIPFYFWNQKSEELPHADLIKSHFLIPAPYKIEFPDHSHYQGETTTGYSYFLNLINMAVKAAWLMGISSENIQNVLNEYQPEPTRTEIWKAPSGATFINDTYCSDPQSVDQALRHFESVRTDQRKVFVFGGMRGNATHLKTDYRSIGKALNRVGIHHLVLFGEKQFQTLIDEVEPLNNKTGITVCANYEEALQYLRIHIGAQDLVLIKGDKKAPFDTLTEAFNDSQSYNQCIINLAAIRENIITLRKKLPADTRLMVIVKALAYGTDDVRISNFLGNCGIDILGVSYVDEGVSLKRAGVKQPIFSINAAPYEISKVVKWDLEVGVNDPNFIQLLDNEAKKQNKPVKVHLHINTGMSRFGCRPEQALELAQLINRSPFLIFEGVMTHFACAEDPNEDEFTLQQVRQFDETIHQLKNHGLEPKWKHAANSSGVIRFQLPQYNMARVGLAAYGLYGSEEAKKALDLRLALTLTSRVVGINVCKKGETISYGRQYKVEKDYQKIAVLPIGYFDGLHRNYSGKAYVLIHGQKAMMVGNICMDYMMIDVTDIPHIAIGDKVLIFGEDEFGQYLSPEDLAISGNSIIHELITCLGPRIQRVFVYEEGRQIR